jgi:photosystem II stability/assembly factor-like uncharacterized protein
MWRILLFGALVTASPAGAQWILQDSHASAGLRGVHALGNGIAWASGTGGTVLRTTDDGAHWQHCAMPPDAAALDFRGVQAFDANTAIVMSSGKGKLSRLYKTTDACRTWRLVFTNPDPEGFWDAIQFAPQKQDEPPRMGLLYGDPVNGRFAGFISKDSGDNWGRSEDVPSAREGEGLFAASNSSLLDRNNALLIVTGSPSGSRCLVGNPHGSGGFVGGDIPLTSSESAGAFSVATSLPDGTGSPIGILVAVGGDYGKPDASEGTAAYSTDGGLHWKAATTTPHGYRSSVAYDSNHKAWIAVGPNGTDISTDDGRNWRALKPNATDASDADRNWNALSLPFVVGPKGRIGKLRVDALNP